MTPFHGSMDGLVHRLPLRVYYEDTDAGGIVYHANYLRYAERARTEMLRCLGFPHQRLIDDYQVAMVVGRLEIAYASPARLDDRLEVRTWLTALGGASLKLSQHVLRDADGGPVICARIVLRLASVSSDGRPVRLPREFLASATPFVTGFEDNEGHGSIS